MNNNSLENLSLIKKMEIDRTHIDEFILDTDEGTKRTKEKFHRQACEKRNTYIQNQLPLYEKALSVVLDLMSKRVVSLMPIDHSNEYTAELLQVDNLLNLVKLNSDISNSFKLKFDFIISSITDNTSLQDLNSILNSFILQMQQIGISLTIKDFQYTMFTERYMNTFFQKVDFSVLKDSFEKIYFACPDIKLQLKMNLEYILGKYTKELEKYVVSLKNSELTRYQVTANDVVSRYIQVRQMVGNKIAMDEYYNTKLFLDGKKKLADYLPDSAARAKNYDMFATNGNFASLEDVEKDHYNSAMMGFYLTLNELKKYYSYEFMIQDLLERYKQKDTIKNLYLTKKKEIDKEESVREGIYKKYLKASGVGLFAKKNEVNMQDAMLKMNEQVRKLHDLYAEYKDMDITYHLMTLNESATIYDLFMTALKSFPFLEKSFSTAEPFSEHTLEENIQALFRFLYNPNNSFLRKINALVNYNVTDVVAEKYKLLNLNITSEMINIDNIDSTLESVRFINLIQNVDRSKIQFHTIENICKMSDILAKEKASEE
ncbi:MAG: hypothetical protein IJI60_04035 [Bacilli bacterium]|nr:hypothetical protein [Bacilli bacterium]